MEANLHKPGWKAKNWNNSWALTRNYTQLWKNFAMPHMGITENTYSDVAWMLTILLLGKNQIREILSDQVGNEQTKS